MVQSVINSFRLLRVLRVLGRYDVLPSGKSQSIFVRVIIFLFRREDKAEGFGHRLAKALQELGPSFVKFGQTLAVRSDLIGEKAADDLALLQDKMPAFDGSLAIKTVEQELGDKIEKFFSRFDAEPVAAASIAQVHSAKTSEGNQVAVKILRPDVEAAFAKDLDLFAWVASAVETLLPNFARFKPREVVTRFQEIVHTELDLRLEAASASELALATQFDDGFEVPQVDWNRTSERVLTIEWVDGIRIDDIEKISQSGLDRREILKNSAGVFFQQVFRDGFFHGDMHPGNMFVTAAGTLVPVDFGIMGRLDRATRFYLADMLMAFLQRDYKKVADIHFDAGLVPPNQSRDAFALSLRSVAEPLFDRPLNQVSIARLLSRLFKTAESFKMEVQPQLLLLQKNMLVAEGVGRKLDSNSNIWLLARPLIEGWMLRNRSPHARLLDGIEEFSLLCRRLPDLAERVDVLLQHIEQDRRVQTNKGRFWLTSSSFGRGKQILFFTTIFILWTVVAFILGYSSPR